MKYLFELNHPKHYYQFKYVMQLLLNEGHIVNVIARDKDVLLDVLKEEKVDYQIFGAYHKNLIGKFFFSLFILISYNKIFKKLKPDLIISKASLFGSLIAKFHKKKSIIFPDSEGVALTNKIVVPLATKVVTPESFTLNYGEKHIRVNGFFENCYLSPSVFIPNHSIVDIYQLNKPYAVFRFISWNANHDVGKTGFTINQKLEIIKLVGRYMTVYVSAEGELPIEILQYKLHTPKAYIHHVLSYADLYVGDSQTMATEAALLGTPAVRFNSFVGNNDMSNFKLLENKYNLLYNFSDYEQAKLQIMLLSEKSQKKEWREKMDKYNTTVGNPNAKIVDIINSI